MTPLDRLLQRWRISKALPHISPGGSLLDIGCGDGELLRRAAPRISTGLGLDPDLPKPRHEATVRLQPGRFPDDLPPDARFDTLTFLAVLEHIPADQLVPLAETCASILNPAGRVVITVPHPAVDTILAALLKLRLIDGMHLEQHHGFDPALVLPAFRRAGFHLLLHRRFQLGLNNLFVFQKP